MQFKKILKCDEYSFKYVKTILESFGYKSLNSPYYRFYVVIVDSNNYVLIKCDSKLSKKYNLSKYMMVNIEEFLYEAAKIAGKEYRRKDIVTPDDLIGCIYDFPIEVVQKMVDYQVKQGNEPDVAIFQKNCLMSKNYGGFDWGETEEGGDFWSCVIDNIDFELYFKKYPKKEQKTMSAFKKKDLIPGKHIVEFNNGRLAMVNTAMNNDIYLQLYQSYITLSIYNDDLVDRFNPEWTIKAVYELLEPKYIFSFNKSERNEYLKLIWSRNVLKLNDIFKAFNMPRYDNLIIELPNGDKIDIKVE